MNSIIIPLLILLNLSIGGLIIYSKYSKLLFSVSISLFILITEYMLLSLLGAYFDFYSSKVFLLISLVINGLPAIIMRKNIVKAIKEFKRPSLMPVPYIVTLVVIMCTVIFTNGLYGMGQDQGVYQVKALALSEGEERNVITLSNESDFLRSTESFDEDYEFNTYSQLFYNTQVGYYRSGDCSEFNAVFHGTVSYPSLLALDVETFGVSGMMYINYALVFISFVFLLEIINLLDINKFLGVFILVIGLASPVVIWVSKASLTESVQLPITLAATLGLILANKNNRLGLFITSVAAISYSVLHLSAFYFLPIIGVLLVINYLRTDDYWALIFNQIITAIYCVSFYVETRLYDVYVQGNLTNILGRMINRELSHSTCVKGVFIVAISLSLMTLLLLIPVIKKIAKKLLNSFVYPGILIGIGAVCGYKILNYIIAYSKQAGLRHALSSLSLFGISVASGFIILPLAILLGVIFVNKLMKDRKHEIVMIMFVYFVIFLASFVHPITPHYYYYSRYFSTSIFYIPLVFALVLDKCFTRRMWGYVIGVLSVLSLLPYSIFVSSLRDDTIMTFSQFEDFTELFKEGDAIVFTGSSQKILLLPTKYTTDADVYMDLVPENSLFKNYDNVYCVCLYDADYFGGELFEEIKTDIENDPQNPHKYFLPLFDYEGVESNIRVYKVEFLGDDELIEYPVNQLGLEGFGPVEIDFAWSASESSSINIYVPAQEVQQVCINFAPANCAIPPSVAAYNIRVYINGELATEKTMSTVGSKIVLNGDLINPGEENKITFEYVLWSPVDYIPGSTDTRALGFAIQSISISQN